MFMKIEGGWGLKYTPFLGPGIKTSVVLRGLNRFK